MLVTGEAALTRVMPFDAAINAAAADTAAWLYRAVRRGGRPVTLEERRPSSWRRTRHRDALLRRQAPQKRTRGTGSAPCAARYRSRDRTDLPALFKDSWLTRAAITVLGDPDAVRITSEWVRVALAV
jgi:hypothetical protein